MFGKFPDRPWNPVIKVNTKKKPPLKLDYRQHVGLIVQTGASMTSIAHSPSSLRYLIGVVTWSGGSGCEACDR